MESKPPRQRRLRAFKEDGTATTVADGLREVFPAESFKFAASSGDARGKLRAEPAAATSTAGAQEDTVVVVGGVVVGPNAPLVDVCACLAHPDNWCYVVVGKG